MSYPYINAFSAAGVGQNGLTVDAWDASRFGGPPAYNASTPSGSPDASATTGTSAGYDGAFVIDLPTTDEYYLSIVYLTNRYWIGPVQGIGAGGGGGPSTVPAPVKVASYNPGDMTNSPPSGAATIDFYSVVDGDRVLLVQQSTGADNGIWVVNTSGNWTRPSDFATASVQPDGTLVTVGAEGTFQVLSQWQLANTVTVDTGSPNFIQVQAHQAATYTPNPSHASQVNFNGEVDFAGFVSILNTLFINGSAFGSSVNSFGPGAIGTLTSGAFYSLFVSGATGPADLPTVTGSINLFMLIKNQSGSSVSIVPNGSDTINGGPSYNLVDGGAILIWADISTSDWVVLNAANPSLVIPSEFFPYITIAGNWYTEYTSSGGGFTPTIDTCYAMGFVCSSAHTFQGIGVFTRSTTGGSSCDMAVYADNGSGYPGALVASVTGVSTAVTGLASSALTAALEPGIYWLCFKVKTGETASTGINGSWPGGSGSSQSATGAAALLGTDSAQALYTCYTKASFAASWPGTFPGGAGLTQSNHAPLMALEA